MTNELETQVGGNHYKGMVIQPIQFIMANNLGFAQGNVVKYLSRWRSKGGIEDLQKANQYLDFLHNWFDWPNTFPSEYIEKNKITKDEAELVNLMLCHSGYFCGNTKVLKRAKQLIQNMINKAE